LELNEAVMNRHPKEDKSRSKFVSLKEQKRFAKRHLISSSFRIYR
jgi:hypothetical protein